MKSSEVRDELIRAVRLVGEGACGILLYTSSPDAEGTLGGLVEVGRSLGRHLARALELARLCSNDPVCAMHRPDSGHEESSSLTSLVGAGLLRRVHV